MIRTLLACLMLLPIGAAAGSDKSDADYYRAIQGKKPATASERFAQLEAEAYHRFDSADVYQPLVHAFALTSERVWALIYGEVFANLTDSESERVETAATLFGLYDDAVSVEGPNKMTISLTKHWTVDPDKAVPPFEMNFEISTMLALAVAMSSRPDGQSAGQLEPLTIRALAAGRAQQLSIWREKSLPETELTRWHRQIIEAGHFEAYHYWLFGTSRPEEFAAWQQANSPAWDAWQQWHSGHRMLVEIPDFQRPVVSGRDPEVALLMAGRAALERKHPQAAIDKAFDVVLERFESEHTDGTKMVFCARGLDETIVYTGMAAAAGKDAIVLEPTWSYAHFFKAYALLELKRLEDARASLERAISMSPFNSHYLAEMAYTFQVESKWEEALERYRQAETAAETYSPLDVKAGELSRALRGQGYALVELGRLDEAEAIYRRAMAADRDDAASVRELENIRMLRNQRQTPGT